VEYVPAPNSPSEVTARAWGTDTVGVSWIADDSTTTASTTGYRVERSPTRDGQWTELIADTGSTDTTFYDTGLSAETTRYYRVSPLSDIGDSFPPGAAVTTTRPTEAEALVTADDRTVVHVGRTTLTFAQGSRDSEFRALASADAASCGVQREQGFAPGAVLECLRVEILGDDGSLERPARLQSPLAISIELSPVQIEEEGGLAELYQQHLNGNLRLLARREPGDPWREISLRFSVVGARPATVNARTNSLGDFALVRPGLAAPQVAAESAGPELPATGGVIEAGMVRLAMFVALAFVAAGAMLASVGGYLVWQRKET
jgi:hypothetical protein